MILALAIVTGVLALVTVLPLSRNPVWWIRGWEFPRIQLGLALALLVAATVILGRPWTGIVATVLAAQIAALTYHLWRLLPYFPGLPVEARSSVREVAEAARCRFLIANVLMSNRNAEGLLDLVGRHRPDLIVTIESDQWWESALGALQQDYPHTVRYPADDTYGIHLHSALELTDTSLEFLVEDNVPSIHATVTLGGGRRIRLHLLHPAPPAPGENEEAVERDAELIVVARTVPREKLPVVVAGDFNDVPWSPTMRLFRRISGLLDPRKGRGFVNTFDARRWYLRWPLDHLYHSSHFTISDFRRLPSFGSDHFPLLVELALQPEAAPHQPSERASPEEEKQAAEMISRQDAEAPERSG